MKQSMIFLFSDISDNTWDKATDFCGFLLHHQISELTVQGVGKIAIKDLELPQACLHLPLIYRSTPLILWIIEKKQRTRETKYCSVNSQMEFHA